jgi:hypothetical protein
VEGLVCETPQPIHGGAAIAITVEVERGSELPHRVQVAPLNPTVHTCVASLVKGERVRIVGLRIRQDGKLTPTQRTVLLRTDDVPIVRVGGVSPVDDATRSPCGSDLSPGE